jgi:hypothetical protein
MDMVVSQFGSELQQKIIGELNKEYLQTGKYIKDQISVSPKTLSALILAGSTIGTAGSAAVSPLLFMATANPDALVRHGGGVLSVARGEDGRFIYQAPFIPLASSIPVVAPLMALQTLSTIIIIQQFSIIDKKIDTIKDTMTKMLARQEVTKVAELFSAFGIVDEIYLQYEKIGKFSTDMLIRLALAERDALILSKRYEMLENSKDGDESADSYADYDTYCTMMSSFLNLRVKYLRTCVDIQENPQFVRHSSDNFNTTLKDSINMWDELLQKSDKIKKDISEAVKQAEQEGGLLKVVRKTREKELSRKKDEYTALLEKERLILRDFHSLIDISKRMCEPKTVQTAPTFIYWRDRDGEHCIATNDKLPETVQSAAAAQ